MVSTTSPIFIDTSFFKALVDKKDDFYTPANKLWSTFVQLNSSLLTSNFILNETLTLLRVRRGLPIIHEFRSYLTSEPVIKILRVTSIDEKQAWEWFFKPWNGLSFTDCVTFAQLKNWNLDQVATFDHHYHRAGFTALPQEQS